VVVVVVVVGVVEVVVVVAVVVVVDGAKENDILNWCNDFLGLTFKQNMFCAELQMWCTHGKLPMQIFENLSYPPASLDFQLCASTSRIC